MKVSRKGLIELASHEGVVPMPYKDSVGVWTFGIGHTKYAGDPNPYSLPKGKAQPLSYVFQVFEKDVEKYAAAVRKAVKVSVSQHEFDALVSFHYNTGAIARATLTNRLNFGDRVGAANAFMNWTTPKEITARRRKEMELFRYGKYGNGKVTVWQANSSGKVLWGTGKSVDVFDYINGNGSEEAELESRYLERGSKGESVRALQVLLQAKGATIKADADFGPATETAVINFQSQYFDPMGKVGKKTMDLLTGDGT